MLCGGNGKPEGREFSPLFSPRSSSSSRSNRRIVVKRQATVAALVVSSVALSGCVAEVGSRSASEDAAMTAEADGTSSVDGAGDANGNQGDDVEDNAGDSEHSKGEDTSAGAGLRGETGATADGDSGVLPSPGEFDPADPDFELFDPCTEIPTDRLKAAGIGSPIGDTRRISGSVICTFEFQGDQNRGGVVGLSGMISSSPLDDSLNREENPKGNSSKFGDVEENELFGDMFCTVIQETVRGVIRVNYSGFSPDESYEEKCSIASGVLANL